MLYQAEPSLAPPTDRFDAGIRTTADGELRQPIEDVVTFNGHHSAVLPLTRHPDALHRGAFVLTVACDDCRVIFPCWRRVLAGCRVIVPC